MVVCVFIFVFFFQADDGIRDGHVTGVQTCALPILAGVSAGGVPSGVAVGGAPSGPGAGPGGGAGAASGLRSEERRVGKECRCRWARWPEKKKDGTCSGGGVILRGKLGSGDALSAMA